MKLKQIRESKNITQEMLARKAEVSLSTIVRAEKTGRCNLTVAKKIAKALNKDIEEIFS